MSSQYDDISGVGMIPRALAHLFDKLRLDKCEFAMRVSYLELYNEELCDLLSTDDNVKIRIFDDSNKKGSVIVNGLKEIPVKCKDDVYKLLSKGQERRKTAATLMNAQSSRSHTVFSILVHIKENGPDGEEMLKIGKLNLVDLAGSENISKAGNEKGIRTRESVNINQSLLTLGRVITALVERAPHVPYRESKLTRLLQESLGGRTKTSIIATISSGHKDLEETLSTLDYAHRAKNIQNKPEINQRLTKKVILKEYTEEIDRLERDLVAAREKNGIYLTPESHKEMMLKIENTEKELNETVSALTKIKEEFNSKMRIFEETKQSLAITSEQLVITEGKYKITEAELGKTKRNLRKTERNYDEAKHIIAVHQETEHKLTEQTKEIIKVADETSQDIKSLQENIRRRKEKDEHAAAFTSNFMSTLTQRLEEMKSEVQGLDKQHKESSEVIVSDLTALKESNKSFTALAVEALTNFVSTQKKFHVDFQTTFDNWIKSQPNEMSVRSFLNASQKKNEEFFSIISTQIETVVKLMTTRKQQEQQLSEFIIQKMNEQEKSDDAFKHYMHMKLNHYSDQLNDFRSSIKTKNSAKNDKIQEIKRLLADIESNTTEQDELMNEKVTCVTSDIQQNSLSTVTNYTQESKTLRLQVTNNVEEKNVALNENHKNVMEQINSTTNSMNDFVKSRKESIDKQLDNVELFEKDVDDQLKAVNDSYKTQHESLVKNLNEQATSNSVKMREITSVVQHNLHLVVQEAQLNVLNNIDGASKDIEQFKNEDVYMYRSTGETPARKEYKFNRQLNQTSPHDRIIKRLRLEQGLSDSLLHDSSIVEVCIFMLALSYF